MNGVYETGRTYTIKSSEIYVGSGMTGPIIFTEQGDNTVDITPISIDSTRKQVVALAENYKRAEFNTLEQDSTYGGLGLHDRYNYIDHMSDIVRVDIQTFIKHAELK